MGVFRIRILESGEERTRRTSPSGPGKSRAGSVLCTIEQRRRWNWAFLGYYEHKHSDMERKRANK